VGRRSSVAQQQNDGRLETKFCSTMATRSLRFDTLQERRLAQLSLNRPCVRRLLAEPTHSDHFCNGDHGREVRTGFASDRTGASSFTVTPLQGRALGASRASRARREVSVPTAEPLESRHVPCVTPITRRAERADRLMVLSMQGSQATVAATLNAQTAMVGSATSAIASGRPPWPLPPLQRRQQLQPPAAVRLLGLDGITHTFMRECLCGAG